MMNTLDYIFNKYQIAHDQKSPIEIPNVGRESLAILFSELGFKVGAEIGVEAGIYSEAICIANPGVKLHCIDVWGAYPDYFDHVDNDTMALLYEEAKIRLSRYNTNLIRKFSMDALKDFDAESLDFVYIDANHMLPYVLDDIYYWDQKVKPGGIVSGHDYYHSRRTYTKCHVKYAVDCYTQSFRIDPWFILGSQEKVEGKIRDKERSWMWVKQKVDKGEYMRYSNP
jgi:hypothetical protein